MRVQEAYRDVLVRYEAAGEALTDEEREEADVLATTVLMACPDSPKTGGTEVFLRHSHEVAEFLAARASSYVVARQAHIDAYGSYATWICSSRLSGAWQKRPR